MREVNQKNRLFSCREIRRSDSLTVWGTHCFPNHIQVDVDFLIRYRRLLRSEMMETNDQITRWANALKTGDAAAKAAFVEATMPKLRKYVMSVLPHERDGLGGVTDVVNSTYRHFLNYCQKKESEIQNGEALLINQAKFCLLRRLRAMKTRKRAAQGSVDMDSIPDLATTPESEVANQDELARLNIALSKLSDEDRALLLRREANKDSWGQIAEEVGVSSRTLQRKRNRLLKLLREQLDQAE